MSSITPKTITTKSGEPVTIRSAEPDDAARLIAFVHSVLAESPFFGLKKATANSRNPPCGKVFLGILTYPPFNAEIEELQSPPPPENPLPIPMPPPDRQGRKTRKRRE